MYSSKSSAGRWASWKRTVVADRFASVCTTPGGIVSASPAPSVQPVPDRRRAANADPHRHLRPLRTSPRGDLASPRPSSTRADRAPAPGRATRTAAWIDSWPKPHGRLPPTLDPADVRAAPEVALRPPPARGGTRAGAQPGLEPGLVLREARARRAPQSESAAAAAAMIRTMTIRNSSTWTAEERAREERARTIRARQDREKTPEERLEETLRLSKLISELQQGAARDVPGR